MSKRIDPLQERSKIISRPEKRPYGIKLVFQVLDIGVLEDIQHVTIFFDDGTYATLAPEHQSSWERGQRLSLTLEGFATASEAERQGRMLVQALLWTSICLNIGVRLNYHTHEPTIVYDRSRSSGFSMRSEARLLLPISWSINKLRTTYMISNLVDRQLLLSMEIFSASRLEASDRAIFLSTVSALEPLATPAKLGREVDTFIKECLIKLKKNDKIRSEYRKSISGRLNELKKESVRQALKKLISIKIPDDESAPAIIDYAYNLRSQLIHRGIPDDLDIDFSVETNKVASIIKELYSKELGLPLDI
jgi:hypothetical protein